jgi:hypothetical protein
MLLQESLLEDAISLLPSQDLSSPPVDAPQAPLPSALAIDEVSLRQIQLTLSHVNAVRSWS